MILHDQSHEIKFINMKEVRTVVELDSFKATLGTYKEPLQEVRDSL